MDAPVPCGPGDIQIASDIFDIVRPPRDLSYGTVYVHGASGLQLAREEGPERLEACAPLGEAPVDLTFTLEHGTVSIVGVRDDFRSDVWTGLAYRASRPRPRDPGRVVRSEPGSTFLAQFDPTNVERISTDTFVYDLGGPPTNQRARFIEVAADGRLLGGGGFPFGGGRVEMVLEVTEREIREADAIVRLPSEGMLAGVPLAEVRPLACDEAIVGPPIPGELDLWSCQYSGVGTITSLEAGLARVHLEYLDGAQIETDALAVRLDDGEVEGVVVVPCCDEIPEIAFPLARSIEMSGAVFGEVRLDIDAPGFDHAFAYLYATSRSVYDVEDDGTLHTTMPLGLSRIGDLHDAPVRQAWAGAITSEDRPPWAAGRPVAWVRRWHVRLATDAPP